MVSTGTISRPESVPLGAPSQQLEHYAFQSVLHRLLEVFLNDYFLSYSSYLLAPWRIRYNQEVVSALVRELHRLKGSEVEAEGIDHLSGSEEISLVLASGYKFLRTAFKRTGGLPRTVCASREFEPEGYSASPYLRELVALHRGVGAVSGDLKAAYLLGSSADFEVAPGFSDVDCFLVLRQETAQESKRLLELRQRLLRALVDCYRVDPLQHHGFFLATEIDLRAYPETFMPLLLLKRGTALLSNEEVLFYLRDDRREAREILARFLQYTRGFARDGGPRTLFHMKLLVSNILLLPALVLHALGQPTYKRDSFNPARGFFSVEAWRAVESASRLRTLWPRTILPRTLIRALSILPNPHAISLAARVLPLSASCRQALADNFLERVTRLIDEAWRFTGRDHD